MDLFNAFNHQGQICGHSNAWFSVAQFKQTYQPRQYSERQGISLSYLEQLFSKLRKRNLVSSVRGPGGGYQLNHSTSDINVAQIIDAVNESIDATSCGGKGDCQQGDICLTHYLWTDLSDQIHHFLSEISLAKLMLKKDRTLHKTSDVQDLNFSQNLI